MDKYEGIINLVSIMNAKREPFNDHHGSQVAAFAMNFAFVLPLPTKDAQLIEIGAQLHDLGKVLMRSELLNATRKLNDVERSEIEGHTTLGWEMACEAGFDTVVCNIIKHHHEYWNGTGYPDGLQGSEIPIEAQIVGLCDCYEALTSKRSYRDAYSHPVAMAMIQKDKRIKFNPELVDLFFAKVAK